MNSRKDGGRPDMIVVGAGIIGASIALALTRRGAAVVVVDQAPGHAAGATGSSGGMVRAYDPDPVIAEFARPSLNAYADGGHWSTGQAPLRRTGAVTIADPAMRPLLETAAARLGPGAEVVSTRQDVLGVRLAGGVGLVERAAGWVDPVAVTRDWLDRAERNGAAIVLGRRAVGVRDERGRPCVNLDDGTALTAGAAVFCLGAWAARPPAGLRCAPPVRTRSIQVCVVRRETGPADHATFVDLRTGAYGRPTGRLSSLLGLPHEVWDVDVDGAHRPSARHTAATLRAVAPHLEGVSGGCVVAVTRSFDGYADDPDLLLPTGVPGVWRVRGWNGGGVKVAPAVGHAVAEQICAGVPDRATR